MSIILASQSPRRRELLAQMGVPQFEVVPALGEEIASPGLSPAQLVEVLSRQKAEEVAVQAGPDDVVIAADTVVAVDGAVLGKPRDPADAARMLSLLSGRAHTVYTGVTVRRGTFSRTAHEATQVRFRPLTQSVEALQKENAELKRSALRMELGKTATGLLKEHNVDATQDILDFVVGENAEETKERIDRFVSIVQAQLKRAEVERATGRTPKTVHNTGNAMSEIDKRIAKYQ